jgi:hypothetical protein
MAMTVFFALNVLGTVFLLYVLANFWKEGHRPRDGARKYAAELGWRDWSDVTVVTYPISRCAQGGLSVIPFRTQDRYSDKPTPGTISNGATGMPVRRFSTR